MTNDTKTFFIGVVVIMATLLGTFFLVNQSNGQRLDKTNQITSERLDNVSQSINQRLDTRFDALNLRFDTKFDALNLRLNSMNLKLNNTETIVLKLNGETEALKETLIKRTDQLTEEIRSIREKPTPGQTK